MANPDSLQLRILHLIECAAAGAGRHVLDLTAGQLARGHHVHIAYSRHHASPQFLDSLDSITATTTPLDLPRLPSPPRDLACARDLRNAAAPPLPPFDVLHAHSTKAGYLARLHLAGFARALVYTPHAPLTMRPSLGALPRALLARMERLLARRCDAIVCVSAAERAHLEEQVGIAARQLAVIPNGLTPVAPPPAQRSGARRQLQVEEGEVAVGFVGRIAPQKGLDILLRALPRLPGAQLSRLALCVVGDGPERGTMASLSDRLGLNGRVRWLGDRPALPLLAGFDAFVMPSRYESMPYSLMEAMRAGLPVVAARAGGVAELVRDQENGLLVPVEDPPAVAHALGQMIGDPERRARLGARARETVARYTADRMVEDTLALYHRLLPPQGRTEC